MIVPNSDVPLLCCMQTSRNLACGEDGGIQVLSPHKSSSLAATRNHSQNHYTTPGRESQGVGRWPVLRASLRGVFLGVRSVPVCKFYTVSRHKPEPPTRRPGKFWAPMGLPRVAARQRLVRRIMLGSPQNVRRILSPLGSGWGSARAVHAGTKHYRAAPARF